MMKNVALIMAAGTSSRCGFDKLLTLLNQQTVLEQCLETFQNCPLVDDLWVVGPAVEGQGKIRGFIPGGATRFQSVKKGIELCQKKYDEDVRLIVHNAANPFLEETDLKAGLKMAEAKENLIFGFFSPNSIKQVNSIGKVSKFLDREHVFETQTPQISPLSNFIKALAVFKDRSLNATQSKATGLDYAEEPNDEAELLALLEQPIYVYECASSNTKITFASDFKHPTGLKIGLGEDSHRFAHNFEVAKPFRLGGIDMSDYRLSSDGNSDGDIILHALCNALLCAYADKTFDPIAAPICAQGETNSVSYLRATLDHLAQAKQEVKIKQVLISLEGSQPKIAPHHEAIIKNIALLLGLKKSQIGLTYTTGEGLSDVGKGLGMKSYVMVTIFE